MSYRPLGKRMEVKPVEKREEKVGSLFIPDTTVEKPVRGEVIRIGEEVTKVKVGDNVLYGRYAGMNIEVGSEKLFYLNEEDVIAVEE